MTLRVATYSQIINGFGLGLANKIVAQISQQIQKTGRSGNFDVTFDSSTSKDVVRSAIDILKDCGWEASNVDEENMTLNPTKN